GLAELEEAQTQREAGRLALEEAERDELRSRPRQRRFRQPCAPGELAEGEERLLGAEAVENLGHPADHRRRGVPLSGTHVMSFQRGDPMVVCAAPSKESK